MIVGTNMMLISIRLICLKKWGMIWLWLISDVHENVVAARKFNLTTVHSCTSHSKCDSFFFLFLPLLSWTILTGSTDIPWHVTLPHTLSSCLLCVVSTSHHLFYPFEAIFMAEEMGEYITPPTGRAAVPVTSHSPHLLEGFFLPVCTEWIW